MLSDDSSSNSETGRFKGKSERKDIPARSSIREDRFGSGRRRNDDNKKPRDFERRRFDRDRGDVRPKERHSYGRMSPVRRRFSRERSPRRRSKERILFDRKSKERYAPQSSKRSRSKEKERNIKHHPSWSPTHKRESIDEMKKTMIPKEKTLERSIKSNIRKSSSPNHTKGKKSEVFKPKHVEMHQKIIDTPIVVEEHSDNDFAEVKPGSYYNMIPAVVKEKPEESSEIDSSDDEKLRARLLRLEEQLHKTKKRKHRKKHKKRSTPTREEGINLSVSSEVAVEVTSTTDIPDNGNDEGPLNGNNEVEVTSTQKANKKESSEEGEITSDNDSSNQYQIDASDLRHKLKRTTRVEKSQSPDLREMLKAKSDVCGPALPPHLEQKFKSVKKDKNIGAFIPDNMRKVLAHCEVVNCESSDEDDGIGPLPVNSEHKYSEAHLKLEERALHMKIKHLDKRGKGSAEAKTREQWMLELPEGKAKILGLEARSFRSKAGPDMSDRSSWTDTPEEKANKAAGISKPVDSDTLLKEEARSKHITARDNEQEMVIKKHKKKHKRDESLLDLHQKKIKKKKKKEENEDGRLERRPFSRDVDLQVNRFDEAQKRSVIKKAQELDTRFSRGESKFL